MIPVVIRGVHPIEAPEPCYLVEIEVPEDCDFDWGLVTQQDDTQCRENWQAAYDERPIAANRWAFFFHHLSFDKPLMTALGPVQLPGPTPRPKHLEDVEYDEP